MLEPGLSLLVVQHPRGGPVKLAMADASIEGINGARTTLTYRVNTEWASSGSPCLFDLKFVALHHSRRAPHNEGVPVAAIVAHLDEAGRAALQGT